MSSLIQRMSHLAVALALLCVVMGFGVGRLDAQTQAKPDPYQMIETFKKKKREPIQKVKING